MGRRSSPARAGALLASLLCSSPSAVFAQEVVVGGQIRLSVNQSKTGSAAALTELRDNASRLSFRGAEPLGQGWRAIFGVEFGTNMDTGALTDPPFRHSYVGLGGKYGQLALGRLDSGTPTGSPFYSQVTALVDFAANDAGATVINVNILNARNRTSNAVGYASPVLGGARFRARAYLRGAGTAAQPESDLRSIDLGAEWQRGPLLLALGYGKDGRRGGLVAQDFDDKWQLGARAVMGRLAVYGLAGRDRYVPGAAQRRDVDYWLLGSSVRVGQHKLAINLMARDVQTNLGAERRRWQAAWTYGLSRRTELQAFVDRDGVDSSRSGVAVRVVGLGVRHNF